MLYITHSQLMRESEQAVLAHTTGDDDAIRRVCLQLLADNRRYALWHSNHDRQMDGVAAARQRNAQVVKLRSVVLEQVHRTALVHYLRERQVVGPAREALLREFHGVVDSRDATLAEHRSYLIATSTQLCATDILALVGDVQGVDLVRRYELLYGQFFGMFCDKSRATSDGEPYMLDAFLPETRDAAERLRLRILDAKLAPVRPVFLGTPQGKDRAPPLRVGANRSPASEAKSLLRSARKLWK
jgi:hypothetical protein